MTDSTLTSYQIEIRLFRKFQWNWKNIVAFRLLKEHCYSTKGLVDVFSGAAGKIGLQINIIKTEVMYKPSPRNPSPIDPCITINGQDVSSFKYLGNIPSTDNLADKEINCWRQSASYGKLEKMLWNRRGIRLATKYKFYKAVVLPALLDSIETYIL